MQDGASMEGYAPPEREDLLDAYEQGFMICRLGLGRDECPYREGEDRFYAWHKAYDDFYAAYWALFGGTDCENSNQDDNDVSLTQHGL